MTNLFFILITTMLINHPENMQSPTKEDKYAITHYYSNDDLENLDNRICYLFNQTSKNKFDSISNLKDFNKTYILHYIYEKELLKKDFLNSSFLENLILSKERHYLYKLNEIRYINPDIILEDLNGKFVGFGNALYFNLGLNYNTGFIKYYQDIIDTKKELNLVEIFTISTINRWELFAKDKNGVTYILDPSRKGLTIKTLSEFVEEHPEIFK
ncbi:hypothetical protein [Dysgonomonas macrotermitis]|uniref:Uncharacterized protein n=1 Tax=Dysgonomonas macrotermitis TaxID=1346286 RepID=A0A1M4YCY7_9BACT|nr:hypothetical protein [Dysgonomonas macrotermitis]SHF03674.1 hypothetical protein SAMN05444362_103138 [Dysgonomonas macrotermitis]